MAELESKLKRMLEAAEVDRPAVKVLSSQDWLIRWRVNLILSLFFIIVSFALLMLSSLYYLTSMEYHYYISVHNGKVYPINPVRVEEKGG